MSRLTPAAGRSERRVGHVDLCTTANAAKPQVPHQMPAADDGDCPGPWISRSVDIKLVAFRVLHPDRVVVETFLGQCASDGAAQAGQPAGLRVDSLPASLDRVSPLATGVDVEVQPVLDHLGIRDDMEPEARA